MNIDDLNKLIRDTVNTIIGLPEYTIKAKQKDAPRPSDPYASVDYVTGTRVGWSDKKYTESGTEDLQQSIESPVNSVFSIDFFKDGARQNAEIVRAAMERDSIINFFAAEKVGILSFSEVREISEPLESGWEIRAQFDLTLNHVVEDVSIIERIKSVEIYGSINGYDMGISVTEN